LRILEYENGFSKINNEDTGRMPSSEMWSSLGLVRTVVSEERVVSIFRMERIHQLGRTLAVTKIIILLQIISKCSINFITAVAMNMTTSYV
jgi:hypothetical protein